MFGTSTPSPNFGSVEPKLGDGVSPVLPSFDLHDHTATRGGRYTGAATTPTIAAPSTAIYDTTADSECEYRG